MSLSLIMTVLALAGAPSLPMVEAEELFAWSAAAPDDVTLYIHVSEGDRLRRELAPRPVADFGEGMVGESKLLGVWRQLARATDHPEGRLFDDLLGRQLTVLGRGDDWVVITEVPRDQALGLADRLDAQQLAPRQRFGIHAFVELDLLMAEGVVPAIGVGAPLEVAVLGPVNSRPFLHEVIACLRGRGGATLADDPAVESGRRLGPGQVAVLVRHAPPLGGWSVATASLDGDRLAIRQHGEYDAAPMSRPVSSLQVCLGILDAFEDDVLIALVEPGDTGEGQFETYVRAVTGEPFISDAVREHLGDHRIVVAGEIEGRLLDDPIDMLEPAVAVCLQVDDWLTERTADDEMLRIARAGRRAGVFAAPIAPVTHFDPGVPRHQPLDPTDAWFGANPLIRDVSLNWSIIETPAGRYWVVATHPDHLQRTLAALSETEAAARRRSIDHGGYLDGERLARHLESWQTQSQLLAAPGEVDTFRTTLDLLADLAGGIDRCRWCLRRPTARSVDLDIRIQLVPPRSADRPHP